MEFLSQTIDVFLHLNEYVVQWSAFWGPWFYVLVFGIIFVETGLVVLPFLPGDSLLFACGALAALSGSPINIYLLIIILFAAAVIGDTVNYEIGKLAGPKVFASEKNWLFNKKHLEKTHAFYEKYGGKTIIIARFVPIIRTFAPFVAGMGTMHYPRFLVYNAVGGAAWVASFCAAGYLFADIPFVQKQFHYVIVAIIVISCLPMVYEFVMAKYVRKS